MSDVKVEVGANIAPYQQKMAQVKAIAKETGEKMGLEGLKGEERLQRQVTGFFKDISSGANVAESAMSRLGESFKMGAGTLVAVAAVQYLFTTMQKGFEIAGKFRDAVKDALSIRNDTSARNAEQMGAEIERLKQASKDTDLASMTNLEASATVVAQAYEKGESISKVLLEDAQEHAEIVQQAHAEEDAAATQSIAQENEILRLKIAGQDAQAEVARDEMADASKMLDLQKKGDQEAIDTLNEQIALKKQLRDVAADKTQAKEATTLQDQIAAEKSRQDEMGKTQEQKLADAVAKVKADRAKIAATAAANTPRSLDDIISREEQDLNDGTSNKTRAIDAQKAQLQLLKDTGAQKEAQAQADTKVADINTEAAKGEQKAAFDQLSTLAKIQSLEDEIAAARKVQADSSASSLQKAQARLDIGQAMDRLVPLRKDAADADKEETEKVTAELAKQVELKAEAAEVGMTGEQKAAALRKKIADEQKSDAAFVGPQRQSQILKEQNQILQDQLDLKKLLAESDKKRGGVSGRVARKTHYSIADITSGGLSALSDPSRHPMSSLRGALAGFSQIPGRDQSGAQTSAITALGGKMDAVHTQLVELNNKVGGVA